MIEHTVENCEKLANFIANEYSLEQLIESVTEELYATFLDDEEVFAIEIKDRGIDKL